MTTPRHPIDPPPDDSGAGQTFPPTHPPGVEFECARCGMTFETTPDNTDEKVQAEYLANLTRPET